MNYYQFLRERRFGSSAVVADAAEGTAGKVDMEAHDRRHHPHGFDPEHDTCKFREELAKADKADMLSPDEGKGGAKWNAKDRADAEETAKVLKRVLGGVEVQFADGAYEGNLGETRKSVKQEEFERWNQILDEYEAGRVVASRNYPVLDTTPAVLQSVGAPALPISIMGGVLKKITGEIETSAGDFHGIPVSELRNLQIELDDPIAVFDSRTQPDSMVVLTRMTDLSNNERAVVILRLDRAASGTLRINDIVSAYGKDKPSIENWIAWNLLRYVNKEARRRSARWLQLPGDSKLRAQSVLTEKDFSDKELGRIIPKAGQDVNTDDEDDEQDEESDSSVRKSFRNKAGKVVGEYDRATGKITLYPGAKVKDVVHEYAHGLWQFAEQEARDGRGALLEKMREIAFSAPQAVKDAVRANYGSEGADVMLEECFAHELARRSDTAFAKVIETTEGRPWYRRAWKTIKGVWKGFADKAGFNKADTKGIEDMSPADAAEHILSQLANGRRFGDVRHDGVGEGRRKAIIGKQGAAALGIGRHDEAAKMERDGASREEIWRKTGWWKGKDGKWRVEVPPMKMRSAGEIDAALRLGNNKTPLEELVRAPELFKAYPSLRDMTVVFDPEYDRGSGGWYDVDAKEIHITHAGLKTMGKKTKRDWDEHTRNQKIVESDDYLRRRLSNMDALGLEHGTFEEEREKAKKWLAGESARLEKDNEGMVRHMAEGPVIIEKLRHEIQHAIQDSEVFATGGMVNDRNYERIAGEVEARNSSRRENMTPEERAETPPWETEDVSEERQIVRYN